MSTILALPRAVAVAVNPGLAFGGGAAGFDLELAKAAAQPPDEPADHEQGQEGEECGRENESRPRVALLPAETHRAGLNRARSEEQ